LSREDEDSNIRDTIDIEDPGILSLSPVITVSELLGKRPKVLETELDAIRLHRVKIELSLERN
jgi:hypothetical protein